MANNDLKESQESERVIEKSPEKDADMTSIIFDAMIKSPESVTLGNIREKIPTNVSRKRIENWICYLKRTGENTGLFSIDLKIKKSKNKNTKTKDEYEDYYDCDNSNNKKTKYIFYESCISKTEIHILKFFFRHIKGLTSNDHERMDAFLNGIEKFASFKDTENFRQDSPARYFIDIVAVIGKAIGEKRGVIITQGDIDINGKLIQRKNSSGKPLIFKLYPIQIQYSHNNICLRCLSDGNSRNIYTLRMDHIFSAYIADRSIMKELGKNDFDSIKSCINSCSPYVCSGESNPEVFVKFLVDKKHLDIVFDNIPKINNKNPEISEYDENTYIVTVRSVKKSMMYLAMQYSEHITVTEPPELVEEIHKNLFATAERYEKYIKKTEE